MKIKIIMIHILNTMAKIKKIDNTKFWCACETIELSILCFVWEYKNHTTLYKVFWEFLRRYTYTNPLTQEFHSQVFTQENYNGYPQKYCTKLFIAALY